MAMPWVSGVPAHEAAGCGCIQRESGTGPGGGRPAGAAQAGRASDARARLPGRGTSLAGGDERASWGARKQQCSEAACGQPPGSAQAGQRRQRRAMRSTTASAPAAGHRLAVVVAVAHQHHRAAGSTGGGRRRCWSRRPSACRRRHVPSALQVSSSGSGSGFLRAKASPPKACSKSRPAPWRQQRPREGWACWSGRPAAGRGPQQRLQAVDHAVEDAECWPLICR
jgi:hypothetical protein